MKARQFDRLARLIDDHALNHQNRLAVDVLRGKLDVLEGQPAQIYLKADQLVK